MIGNANGFEKQKEHWMMRITH